MTSNSCDSSAYYYGSWSGGLVPGCLYCVIWERYGTCIICVVSWMAIGWLVGWLGLSSAVLGIILSFLCDLLNYLYDGGVYNKYRRERETYWPQHEKLVNAIGRKSIRGPSTQVMCPSPTALEYDTARYL
ncbi:hypothetical protein HOY80DRAFT_746685 [Tuber brumale]|nr:hypothetical protein HOY80DRAFT_746685 [Tuber brumale]